MVGVHGGFGQVADGDTAVASNENLVVVVVETEEAGDIVMAAKGADIELGYNFVSLAHFVEESKLGRTAVLMIMLVWMLYLVLVLLLLLR